MADGSVIFQTALDNRQLAKDLASAKKKIQSVTEQIQKLESKKITLEVDSKNMGAELNQAKAQLEALRKEQASVNKALELGAVGGYTAAEHQAAFDRKPEIDNEVAEQQKIVNALQKEWDAAQASIGKYSQQIAESNTELDAAKTKAGELQQMLTIANIGAGIKDAGKGIVDSMKKMISVSGKAAKSLLSLFGSSEKTNGSFLSGLKTMLSYSVGVRSLYALVNKLRSALAEGLQNLAQFSASTNQSISALKSALSQLKNSLATAFAPILTVIEPIITKFINMLATAADYVARLTAALTGQKSYVRATKVQENYAKSLGGTADAAKEAQKSIMGFDELNTLQAEPETGGGASGGAGAFEEVPIEPMEFASWGEAFNAMLDSIINNGIPRLKEAFTSFSGWLNGFSANLYEMFSFPGVYDKIVLLGSEIAMALNALASQIDWATLGGAIGAGLNSALAFLVSLVYTFDWMALGSSLALSINNMVAEIDWYALGQWLWAKFKIAIETLVGFLQNLDMAQLAQAAEDLVMGFFNSVYETLASIDWQQLGNQVAEFLTNIDWVGVSGTVFSTIGAAFGAIGGFLVGLLADAWKEVADHFQEWIEETVAIGGDIVSGLLAGIIAGLVNIGVWIWNHMAKPLIDGFCELLGIHSPSTVFEGYGDNIVAGLLNGITAAWGNITGFFGNALADIKKAFSDAWNSVRDTAANIWDGIVGAIKGAINGIISAINGMISGVVNGINIVSQTLNAISFDIPSWVPGFGGITFGFNLPQISAPQIPLLAQGAVIPPNREFLAVLGDQRHGTNIEAPLATIEEAVARVTASNEQLQVLREQNELLRQILSRTGVYLDGRKLAEAITPHQRNMERARGR